jgi:transposase
MASFGCRGRERPGATFESYGPHTTCYNRFVRWRKAGIWDQIMKALAAGHDAAVHMIDTSVVRVRQHGACIADNNRQDIVSSRGA